MADIINYFGTPQELARTYLDCVPEKDMRDYALKKKFYSNITKIILIVMFLITIIFAAIILPWYSQVAVFVLVLVVRAIGEVSSVSYFIVKPSHYKITT